MGEKTLGLDGGVGAVSVRSRGRRCSPIFGEEKPGNDIASRRSSSLSASFLHLLRVGPEAGGESAEKLPSSCTLSATASRPGPKLAAKGEERRKAPIQ